MPPRGVEKGTKRARQYEHIKESAEERGMSEGRAEEIAARTVNKERARAGSRGRRRGARPATCPRAAAAACDRTGAARRVRRRSSCTTRRSA